MKFEKNREMMELGEAEDWVQQPSQNSKLAEHNFRGEKKWKAIKSFN